MERGLFALEGLFVRNGQSLTALLTAGSQHPAAIGCRHAFTEAVLVRSLLAGGLIGAFHGR